MFFHPNIEEVIRPILRGRDIKRYSYDFAGLYLITIPYGWTNKNKGNEDAETFFKNTFPTIYQHFVETEKNRTGSGKGLYNRDDKGQYWWELRSCVYMDDFLKIKIVYPEFLQSPCFYLDTFKLFVLDTAWFMEFKNLNNCSYHYLISILNSKLFWFFYQKISVSLGEKAQRMKKQFIEKTPIPMISEKNQKPFENLVNEILEKKALGQNTQSLENEIDNLVFALYELTNEEIDFILNPKI